MLTKYDFYHPVGAESNPTLAKSALYQGLGPMEIDNVEIRTSLLVHQILNEIGLWRGVDAWCQDEGDVCPGKVIEALVQCRLQNDLPVPLHLTESWLSHSLVPHLLQEQPEKLNEFRLGRVLEKVGRVYEPIWADLIIAATKEYKLEWNDVLYDLTSIYFEGKHEDSELARHGYSRDDKPDKKQISIALDYGARDKVPLLYKVHPGNTTDVATVRPNMDSLLQVAKALGTKPGDVRVIGDRALLTPELVRDYVSHGIQYIGCMQGSKSQDEFLRGFPDELLKKSPLAYQPKGKPGGKYYGVRSKFTLPPTKRGRKVKDLAPMVQDVLVVLSMGARNDERAKREEILRRIETRLETISSNLNQKRYTKLAYAREQVLKALSHPIAKEFLSAEVTETVHEGKPLLKLTWRRNKAEIQDAEQLDGKFVVFFESTEELTNDEVFEKLKTRNNVEQGQGHLKNHIRVRPIYLQNDDRILGLVFVCMVSLFVATIIERQLRRHGLTKMTYQKVENIFHHHHASVCTFRDLSQHVRFRRPTGAQIQIMQALGMNQTDLLAPFVVGENTRFSQNIGANQTPEHLAKPPTPD